VIGGGAEVGVVDADAVALGDRQPEALGRETGVKRRRGDGAVGQRSEAAHLEGTGAGHQDEIVGVDHS